MRIPRPRLVALALPALLAAALLLPAAAPAAERTVTVGAEVTIKVANDTASIGLSTSAEKRSRGAALRTVSERLRKVIAAVQKISGVGPGDIRTGRVNVRRSFRGGEVPLYRASQGIGVTLHEPQRAGSAISAAIAAGATGVSGPNYFVGDADAAERQALGAAFAKAKSKATTLAVQAGGTLGRALAIEEGEVSGDFAEPPFAAAGPEEAASDCAVAKTPSASPGSAGTAAGPVRRAQSKCVTKAPPPTKPGNSTVSATVRVIFELL